MFVGAVQAASRDVGELSRLCALGGGGVAGVKIAAAVIGAVRFRRMAFLHTYANKLTGAAVFLLPYFHSLGCFTALCAAVCAIAVFAAAEELACVLKMKEYDAEKRGVIWQKTD